MEKRNIIIVSVIGILIIIVSLVLFFVVKSNADKKKEEEYKKLVADLCVTTLDLSETKTNTIVIDKNNVGSYTYVSLETLSLLTVNSEDKIPRNIVNPKESNSSKDVYFPDTYAIKLIVDSNKKVVCDGLFDLGNTPKITLKGSLEITINKGSSFEEPGFSASDKEDGNLTDKVLKNNNIDTSKTGEYLLLYYVEDSMGNKTSAIRKIIVK